MSNQLEYDVATILNICGEGISDILSDTLEGICVVFKEVSYSGHIPELDLIEVSLSSHNITYEDAIESVIEVMMTASEECLKLIGVSVNPDIPPPVMLKLLSALVTFDVTEFPQTMMDIVEASEDPVECAVNILDFISSEEINIWYDNITEVEVSFVENIKTLLLEAIDRLPPEFLEIYPDFNKKRKLIKEIYPENILSDYTTEAKDLNTLIETYSEILCKLPSDVFIKEVVALASLSNDDPNVSLESVDSIIEDFMDDPQERIQYNHLISKTKESLEHVFFRSL